MWPSERLAQVKTYWQHQSAIHALSREALTESETTLQYAYRKFEEDHDYAPQRMEVQNPSGYSCGPPGGGPPTIIPHWENHDLLRIATMVEAMEDHQFPHMEEVEEAEEDPHRMVTVVMEMVGLKDPMNRVVQLYSHTMGMRVKEAAALRLRGLSEHTERKRYNVDPRKRQ